MNSEGTPVFEPGDVVFGADPYKGNESGRPWLILSNHDGQPFHGQQYIALSLTTRTWLEGLIEIEQENWIHGGTPAESRIIPLAIQSIAQDDIDDWQGRLAAELVGEAIEWFVAYIRT